MESYISLYRKWRPQKFSEVVGQIHVTKTISNSIKLNRTSHAYLFSGSRGTGKTTTAKILAKVMNCENGPATEPCNSCANCLAITAGSSMDVVEMDAASNRGIDEIRSLRERIYLAPTTGRTKVYIIDEVHMLTVEASNALLKMLEEPPANTIFVLATTEPHKILPTIVSRCQRYDFRRIPLEDMVSRLKLISEQEGIAMEEDALTLVARSAGGSLRDAIGLLDQLSLFAEEGQIGTSQVLALLGRVSFNLLSETVDNIVSNNVAGVLKLIDNVNASGQDMLQFSRELSEYFRKLMVANYIGSASALELTKDEFDRIVTQSRKFGEGAAAGAIELLEKAISSMRWSGNPRIPLELALLKMCKADEEIGASAPVVQEVDKPAEKEAALKVQKPEEISEPEVVEHKRKGDTSVAGDGDIASRWWVLMEKIQKRNKITHALLRECQPKELREHELVLCLPRGHNFHLDRIQKPPHSHLIEEVIQEEFGLSATLRIEISDDLKPRSVGSSEKVKNRKALEELKNVFDAKVIKTTIELEDGTRDA